MIGQKKAQNLHIVSQCFLVKLNKSWLNSTAIDLACTKCKSMFENLMPMEDKKATKKATSR